jgi:hypothetical protein
MISSGWLFKKSLLFVATLSSAPYITWPLFILASLVLLTNKFRPMPAWHGVLVAIWWILLATGIVLGITLVVAFFSVPENDRVANIVLHVSLIASLPILIPSAVALFCKPTGT